MKHLLLAASLVAASSLTLVAQPKAPPKSPAETATATIAGKEISIKYSSPRVRGREGHIFTNDGLISHDPHYPVWRAGANSATTLTTSGDVKIGNLMVPKGTYTLFVDISNPDEWTLIVNKKTGEWGLAYDGSQDLGKVKMKMSKPATMVEDLKYTIDAHGKHGTITLAWENHAASVPITAE
ncbi:MAG: DUF2911 domain-containing protein [Acidobacteriota bacterium]|nr:DUF2911 domain-containing protein [Acidobacteriota bacterium]